MVLNTEEEVAEQIPSLNIVKSFKKEFCFFILELILILASLFVLIFALLTLFQESHWIKDIFTKECTEDHLNWIFRYYEDRVDRSAYTTGRTIIFVFVIMGLEITHLVIRRKYGDLLGIE